MGAGPSLDPPQLVSRGPLELRGAAVFEFGRTTVHGKAVADAARDEIVLSDLEAGTDFATGEHGKAGSSVSGVAQRSEEHTSELQSQSNLVCRLLLEKKTKIELRTK